VRTGDIIVVEDVEDSRTGRHPGAGARGRLDLSGRTWMIKRAAAVPGDPVPASVAATVSAATGARVPDGRLIILGDNTAASIDSRRHGYLSEDAVLGVVVRRLRPSDKGVTGQTGGRAA
jgi:signal peptidase I